MRGNLYKLLAVVIMVSFIVGCGLKDMTNAKENVPMIPTLNEEAALKLRTEAIAKFYSVFHDGGGSAELNDERIANDEYYYYFCDDLDSLEKIKAALLPFFSTDIVSELVDSYPISEINGKLSYQPYDVGSMLKWDEAKGTLKKDQADVKVYEFIVPDIDGVTEPIEVEFVNIENSGWRINTDPVNIL
ncbi:DL-endopeptidase inhibitor IseA family protein [Paenibacillus lutimineralis]|uniref:DUF3993 domain-containing protein n=1 Tax=Paenibacillus lutimineralis TaxID=2707005 RepID=A0A3S9UUQ3_9BACL|nr:DL-endopeptidase inhibitor IseA family protein [Paenibacillus lutimineralis]AZS14045.1 hypothetical protein EI981_05970 [Paenibacillus lutimineralis]